MTPPNHKDQQSSFEQIMAETYGPDWKNELKQNAYHLENTLMNDRELSDCDKEALNMLYMVASNI